jgi:hypothetical protein
LPRHYEQENNRKRDPFSGSTLFSKPKSGFCGEKTPKAISFYFHQASLFHERWLDGVGSVFLKPLGEIRPSFLPDTPPRNALPIE